MKAKENTGADSRKLPEAGMGQGKIIVERSFGKADLMELYSDYVAGKIQSRLREETVSKNPVTPRV